MQPEGKPEWLDSFLQRTYFGSCELHEPPKNEQTKYCIDCDSPACLHCINAGTHAEHRVLKIYRHVYKDVILRSEMEKHIDCSKIQVLFPKFKNSMDNHLVNQPHFRLDFFALNEIVIFV